ncbi:MAG: hypothetical protein IKO99_11095 [Bacteroidales bacterium]|nr:hypothetical protein [Bacteroidales bacterium]
MLFNLCPVLRLTIQQIVSHLMVKELVSRSLSFDPQGYRAEFLELVTKAEK